VEQGGEEGRELETQSAGGKKGGREGSTGDVVLTADRTACLDSIVLLNVLLSCVHAHSPLLPQKLRKYVEEAYPEALKKDTITPCKQAT
jgi:hypothetical protein